MKIIIIISERQQINVKTIQNWKMFAVKTDDAATNIHTHTHNRQQQQDNKTKYVKVDYIDTDLVVKPNWIAHVNSVFRRCGVLHSNFVCDQISAINIFISFGFRILSARTDLLVRLDIVLMLSGSLKLLIYQKKKMKSSELLFHRHFVEAKSSFREFVITGYSERFMPVFSWYMSLKISSASSVSPHSIKNFGLSGKKNNHEPSIKLEMMEKFRTRARPPPVQMKWYLYHIAHTYLGIAQIATNRFQLWNRNQPCLISTFNGMISHAIPIKLNISFDYFEYVFFFQFYCVIFFFSSPLHTGQCDNSNSPEHFHPAQNILAIFSRLKFAQVRKTNAHCTGHPESNPHTHTHTAQFIWPNRMGAHYSRERIRHTQIHWKIERTWISNNIVPPMTTIHKRHQVIELQSTLPFCLWCRPSSPRNTNRTTCLDADEQMFFREINMKNSQRWQRGKAPLTHHWCSRK